MSNGQVILIGWKDLCDACGIKSVKTMRNKVIRHHIPVKMLDKKPHIAKETLIDFFENLQSGLVKGRR